jgi:hypothetical protein
LGELTGQQASQREDDGESEHNHRHDGDAAWCAEVLDKAHQGRQHKAEKDCQSDRNEDFPTKIERRQDEGGNNSVGGHTDDGSKIVPILILRRSQQHIVYPKMHDPTADNGILK